MREDSSAHSRVFDTLDKFVRLSTLYVSIGMIAQGHDNCDLKTSPIAKVIRDIKKTWDDTGYISTTSSGTKAVKHKKWNRACRSEKRECKILHSSLLLLAQPLKEIPTASCILSNPKLLINFQRVRSLGLCVSRPALSIPNLSLHLHRATEPVWEINHVQPGSFDVGVRIVEFVLIMK